MIFSKLRLTGLSGITGLTLIYSCTYILLASLDIPSRFSSTFSSGKDEGQQCQLGSAVYIRVSPFLMVMNGIVAYCGGNPYRYSTDVCKMYHQANSRLTCKVKLIEKTFAHSLRGNEQACVLTDKCVLKKLCLFGKEPTLVLIYLLRLNDYLLERRECSRNSYETIVL